MSAAPSARSLHGSALRTVLLVLAIVLWCAVVHHDLVAFLWDRVGVSLRGEGEVDVNDLLVSMSLDEKIAQLHGTGQMRGTVNRRLDIPPFETADGPHGVGEAVWRYLYRHTDRATAFPAAIAIAASWDPDLAARVGAAIAAEARAKGRNWLLAPALDLVRDPRAGRVFEAYGEDPYLSGRLGAAFVRAAQAQGVIATPKHFVCHHQETLHRDVDARVGDRALRELYLAPFEAAVREGGAHSIMAAGNSLNGIHCTEHEWLLRTVLRDEWGFNGVVISDWDATTSTVASIDAGLDVEMPRAKFYGAPLVAAVESARLPASRIEETTRRVLATKLAAGLFSRPLELDPGRVGSAEHRELALEAARDSIVLLENKGDFLPLRPKANSTIAILGPWARRAVLGGRGSSEVKPFDAVSIADGLRSVLPEGVDVETASDWRDDRRVAAIASDADVVVLALGLGPRLEGESLDRVGNDLTLPADQVELIDRVLAITSRVVVVLYAGSAIAMDPWIDRVPAVVLAWYPGELGSRAVGEVLLGLVDPSGKLPLTFPHAAAQLPAFGAFPERDSVYREGVFVGYRHFDANALEPLFPFGHGLSYTRFEYSDLVTRVRRQGRQIAIDLRFVVRNAGDRAGTEVAQVYVHDVEASVARPPRELKRFARLRLEAGESREVKLSLGYRDLAFFDEATDAWMVEPGAFEVQVGASSRDLRLRQQFTYAAQ